MKVSLTTSAIIHISALAFALVTLGTPEQLDVANTETLPVDLVPIEEFSQIQQGEKTAPMTETAAPIPTTRPDHVENAENVGDNKIDIKSPPLPSAKPSNNESAAAPASQEKPTPVVDTKPTKSTEIAKEETAPPPQEVAALPQPKPDVTPPKPTPEPTPTPEPAEKAADEIPLPDSVPVPAARPKPEVKPEPPKVVEKPPEKKPETPKAAEKPTDKKIADKKQEVAKSTSAKQSDFNADDVAALLNKQEPANGGAKRSTQTASLGGKTNTGGKTLSQSEMDALRGQIQNNWSMIAGIEGADGVIIRVAMKLDESGAIVGRPEVTASGGSDSARRTLEGSALRAVMRSSPFKNLPADKYDTWSEVIVNFDPSELL